MPPRDRYSEYVGFLGLRGPAPWPLLADAYTASSAAFASAAAKQRSTYNLTNRRCPAEAWPGVARDSRMVFYGLADFVRQHLTAPIEEADVEAAEAFMARAYAFGGGLPFDGGTWRRAIREFGGRLPIRIQALPEGQTFWPDEPVVQVTSLGDGFGEPAAHVEAVLLGMVACATARATVTRHLFERMRREVRSAHPGYRPEGVDAVAAWMVHDFGMRAHATALEADIMGRAHLLSFNGTDTFNAAFHAWADSDDDADHVGTSILAHAHRIILGHDEEGDAVRALADAADRCGDQAVASYLADTFDFPAFIEKLAVPLAREFRARGRGVVVVRNDSGDLIEGVDLVLKAAFHNNLFSLDEWGHAIPTHLKFVCGDSMNPDKIEAVFDHLRERHANTVRWGGFGIGGWLRAQANRDVLSSAYKLAACGHQDRPVVKLSATAAKMSVPGPTELVRHDEVGVLPTAWLRPSAAPEGVSPAYVTYYDGAAEADLSVGDACLVGFGETRRRSLADWDRYAGVGLRPDVLSPGIWELREATLRGHGRAGSPPTAPSYSDHGGR